MRMIKCPYCCEEIPADSKKCPYCGEELKANEKSNVEKAPEIQGNDAEQTEKPIKRPNNKKAKTTTIIIVSVIIIAFSLIADIVDHSKRNDSYSRNTASTVTQSSSSQTSSSSTTSKSSNAFVDSETGIQYILFDDTKGKGVATGINYADGTSKNLYLNTNYEMRIIADNYELYWPKFTPDMVSSLEEAYRKCKFFAESEQYMSTTTVYSNNSGGFYGKDIIESCNIDIDLSTGLYSNEPKMDISAYLLDSKVVYFIFEVSGKSSCEVLINSFKALTNNISTVKASSETVEKTSGYEPKSNYSISKEALRAKDRTVRISEGRSVQITSDGSNAHFYIVNDDHGTLEIPECDIVRFGNMCKDFVDSDYDESFTFVSSEGEFTLWGHYNDNIVTNYLSLSWWEPNIADADKIYEIYFKDAEISISLGEDDLRTIINVIFN